MLKRYHFVLLLLASLLLFTTASAETSNAAVTEVRTQIGDNVVAYPQLEGMADEALQKQINDDIVLSADVTSHFITLSTLGDSAWGLVVEHRSYLGGDVFSTVISAKGKMPSGREGHSYVALSYDLQTGERLTLQDLFKDANAAVAHMEQIAESTLSGELSGYMEHGELLPLPKDAFAVDSDGITFYYPADQFSLLSGYSGACQFYYDELSDDLRTDEAGIPARIDALPKAYTAAEAKRLIQEAVENGVVEHVPAKLNDKMSEVIEKYRLLRTPDESPAGRCFILEDPLFRQVIVISDAIESGYERSVVEGIQLRRGNLYGLQIDASNQADWLAILGEPDETIVFTENMAYDYNLPVGQSDIYHYGGNELRLHSDQDGLLVAIQIGK